ncbi:hypothetical protein EV143_11451 [Flavobacterium chryseum]|uniref:hypothetical protein n=1 Tax=Flavobacterium sp. P3160 TaxID=2512113 RepID=UPI00105CB096|nr:hypothetical protein [Flavobacterium sp. P3160]TDO69814.1 hypothetical protein EV143_11451 [Flavobacterium sp. P3160]
MKKILLITFVLVNFLSRAQQIETITIPNGIVYNYCNPKVIEKAKKLIIDNLSNTNGYKIVQDNLIIGPELWKRFKDKEKIQNIKQGKVEFHVDDLVLDGKMSNDINDSKIIWDEFKNEVAQDYKIRKANEEELKYYWSVISFDIDEPLLIIETKEHNYILNLLKKDLKLLWLDEAPKPGAVKQYQNGKEAESISKGVQETKLEKVVLLSSDEEINKNSSIDDINLIIDNTNQIFEELFKNSLKPGKIMVQFQLNKENNDILFAVKDLDLDIMKEFEKRINSEKYPNSKKDSIKLQLIFKVNSF